MLLRLENQPWKVMKKDSFCIFSFGEGDFQLIYDSRTVKTCSFQGNNPRWKAGQPGMDKNWHSRLSKYIRLSDTWNKHSVRNDSKMKSSLATVDKVKVIPKTALFVMNRAQWPDWELFADLKEHLNLSVCVPTGNKIFPIPNKEALHWYHGPV